MLRFVPGMGLVFPLTSMGSIGLDWMDYAVIIS